MSWEKYVYCHVVNFIESENRQFLLITSQAKLFYHQRAFIYSQGTLSGVDYLLSQLLYKTRPVSSSQTLLLSTSTSLHLFPRDFKWRGLPAVLAYVQDPPCQFNPNSSIINKPSSIPKGLQVAWITCCLSSSTKHHINYNSSNMGRSATYISPLKKLRSIKRQKHLKNP